MSAMQTTRTIEELLENELNSSDVYTAVMGDLELTESFELCDVQTSEILTVLDEVGQSELARYLGINRAYFRKCSDELKIVNLRGWMKKYSEVEVQIFTRDVENQEDSQLVKIQTLGSKDIDTRSIVKAMGRVLGNDAELILTAANDDFLDVRYGESLAVEKKRGAQNGIVVRKLASAGGLDSVKSNKLLEDTYFFDWTEVVTLKKRTFEEVLGELEGFLTSARDTDEGNLEAYDQNPIPDVQSIPEEVDTFLTERGISERVVVDVKERVRELVGAIQQEEGKVTPLDVAFAMCYEAEYRSHGTEKRLRRAASVFAKGKVDFCEKCGAVHEEWE